MPINMISRRAFMIGAVTVLPSCSVLSSLEGATEPLDAFDLVPISGATQGPSTQRTLLVLQPAAPAAIDTDRILVRPDPQAVTYLPGARWADDLPLLMQSVLIRSLASGGRVGFVGTSDAGPVPDVVLLTRIDQFEVAVLPGSTDDPTYVAQVALTLTLLRDIDQRIIGSRTFAGTAISASDRASVVAAAFQQVLNGILPAAVEWSVSGVAR